MTGEQLLKDIKSGQLYCGDCLAILPTLAENSIDACVTDPPYHLTEVPHVKRGGFGGARDEERRYARRGFMGKQWDGGDVAADPATWAAVYRVLKPGAHLLAFGGTRTSHRMACAIEDAGFEIRDTIMWLYGSGFPKSHDVSKGIDRAAGAERERIGTKVELGVIHGQGDANCTMHEGWRRPWRDNPDADAHFVTLPATAAARQWEGWGTALKPAVEPIILARKPLSEGTVAANVIRWGTGAINIDGCRVESGADYHELQVTQGVGTQSTSYNVRKEDRTFVPAAGRWPANVIHDGSEEVLAGFPDQISGGTPAIRYPDKLRNTYGAFTGAPSENGIGSSEGSAARFFYTAKADFDDRIGSKHPTIKPLDLMQYLVRLVCPRGGLVLDPFAGTGTTGEAAIREGMRAVLIEREAEYQADIRRRMQLIMCGEDERTRESIKAAGKVQSVDDLPLFAAAADDYDAEKDAEGCFNEAYRVIRERMANGGPGWEPK